MPWTQSQQVTLALIPKFSAVLSLMGSMAIVWECLYLDRLKLNRVYHRLLFVMSLCDILESCWNFTSTWPIPKGTPNIAFAAGNTMTCEFQGFVLQFGLATPILNMCLSIYYLLVIKFSWTEEMIKRRAEPWFHTAAFSIALGTCFACVAMDQFNNSNLWCWISPFPLGCKDSFRYGDDADCIRGDNAWIYRWAFYYVELWFAILFVAVAMSTVYITVVKLEKANKRFMSNSHRNLLKDEKAKKGKVSKSRRVAGQALWYVLAFFMTFLFSTINRLLQLVLGHTFFPLVCLHATFDPLQGEAHFKNLYCAVFIR